MRMYTRGFLAVLPLLLLAAAGRGADSAGGSGRLEDQAALKPFSGLVGDWRGTAQVERGKVKGAWTESSSWAWKLTKESAALEGTIARGKYLKSLLLKRGAEPHAFSAEAVLPDGSTRRFTGTSRDGKKLVLNADRGEGEGVKRITLTPLHDTRLLVLLEARDDGGGAYRRLGEVGYTRQGVTFAAGESGPKCVVTDGRGTISVSYKGKTYYVCCTGCRDLFNENPEAVLAEAEQRKNDKP